MKNVAPSAPPPHFGPASQDFHLNRPVNCSNILNSAAKYTSKSSIQLHIVPPAPPAGIVAPSLPPPIWLVPEPPLITSRYTFIRIFYNSIFKAIKGDEVEPGRA